MDDCIDHIGHAKYVSKFDLLKGFWQIPLTERAKAVSAFVTPDGHYQYKVMPYGMKNSPASFQRLVNHLINDLPGCKGYIDDIIIYSDDWETHVDRICALFHRLSEANLSINLSKCEFGQARVTYLGHVVGQGEVKPVTAKIESIIALPPPKGKRELMSFIFRKFCRNFSDTIAPLTDMLRKSVKFKWSDKCQQAFDNTKALLTNAPVLAAPDFNSPFYLATDASDIGAGAVLMQKDVHDVYYPVSFFSKKFNLTQQRYSTIEKETYALILSLTQFEVYLRSTLIPVKVFSDHNPLVFIDRMKNKNQKIMRWSLFLQEFNLEINHVKGKDNVVADLLSRS